MNEAAQINYAGTGTINMGGHAATTAMVDASNAAVSLGGTADFYGSIVAASTPPQKPAPDTEERDAACAAPR